jgi:hypothetical protein
MAASEGDLSQYVFYARTVKASPIRNLVDAVKDILTEVNLEIDGSGIKIMAMDGTHTILVHMRLYADRFDTYHCTQKCILGVDFVNLNKMVKQIKNEDSLLLFMERSNMSRLGIRIMNGEKQMVTTKYLNLMELDIKPIEIPAVTFPSVITMPSLDFQNIVKDLILLGRQGGDQVGGERAELPAGGRRLWIAGNDLYDAQAAEGDRTGLFPTKASCALYKVYCNEYGYYDLPQEQLSDHH